MADINLYEVLVPASFGKSRFTYEHHKEWDAFVLEIAGGLTIMRGAKGEWINPSGKIFRDRIIPCRVACTAEQLDKIINFTIKHYDQEAVMAYRIGKEVIIKYAPGQR